MFQIPDMPSIYRGMDLSDNARTVLKRRYLRKGPDGEPIETVEEMIWRIATSVAAHEDNYERYYDLIASKDFLPNSPTFTGAGTPLGQLAACFVLPIEDDMGGEPAGIFQTLRDAALIQQTGGGNGFSFSRLRSKGSFIVSSGGKATGPIGFMKAYDASFGVIQQGGVRRSANMAVLRVDHPDIEEFIDCKSEEGEIANFNISVGITDKFMEAVEGGGTFNLEDPRTKAIMQTVDARELFDKIVKAAHRNGEPGLLFLDTANRYNPFPHLGEVEATNPCGEIFLLPYQNCCLGSINLANHVDEVYRIEDKKLVGYKIDFEKLKKTIMTSVSFLDDVIDANKYVPAVPQLEEAAKQVRRIGLGIMGLADMLYMLGIRYGSADGFTFAMLLMEFIRYYTMQASIELAKERGPFLAIEGSIYDIEWTKTSLKENVHVDHFEWYGNSPEFLMGVNAMERITKVQEDYGFPIFDWDVVANSIAEYGIRNGAQLTIAPTGTIATVAGVEGYGCEPVFALAYMRHFIDDGQDVELNYVSPLFEEALREYANTTFHDDVQVNPEAWVEHMLKFVAETGSCQNVKGVPQEIKDVFVVSQDIAPEQHVKMQAAMQMFVDNAISKTCNFSADATEQYVAKVYMNAWKHGCKGLTVYVTGSREKVVLETQETLKAHLGEGMAFEGGLFGADGQKITDLNIAAGEETSLSYVMTMDAETGAVTYHAAHQNVQVQKKPRPGTLSGRTHKISTPAGKAFVTINSNGDDEPFEVFITTAKAGSEIHAVAEAIGRLASYVLRLASPVSPRDRLKAIRQQLQHIGGGRQVGLGPTKVVSLPDGIAQAIGEELKYVTHGHKEVKISTGHEIEFKMPLPFATDAFDLCPECGELALRRTEGCDYCDSCSYSSC